MAVLYKQELKILSPIFRKNGIKLYHACQFQDHLTSKALGGIPSRSKMEETQSPFTPFTSDYTDRAKDVHSKVFGNCDDFGRHAHRGRNSIFNIYGPILYEIAPESLEYADDASFTLCSITSADREKDGLSIAELERIFNSGAHTDSRALRALFPDRRVTSLEFNLTMPEEIIPFIFLERVLVDPLSWNGSFLIDHVEFENVPVKQRFSENYNLYCDIVQLAGTGITEERDLLLHPFAKKYPVWISKVINIGPARNFLLRNFLNYLRVGTLKPMESICSTKAI